MNEKLLRLLQLASTQMINEFAKASIEGEGTPQEVADRNEGYVSSFFRKYFPYPYRVEKGNIIDSFGKKSMSIDCLILNPSHPYTVDANNNKASVIFADGVDYAIEIKSKLSSKDEIARALKQIQSVKKLRRVRNGVLNPYNLDEIQLECSKTIPSFIFANETYASIENCWRLFQNTILTIR